MKEKLSFRERLYVALRGKIPTSPPSGSRRPFSFDSASLETLDADRRFEILKDAERGETRDLFALYRDIISSYLHLQAEFSKRKMAVLGDVLTIHPRDEESKEDVAAAKAIETMMEGCNDWISALSHLMDSALYPIAIVSKVFRQSRTPGLVYELDRLIPVEHDLLCFRDGGLSIYDIDDSGSIASTTKDTTPSQHIIHRGNILSTPDYWGGPMRAIVFWWLLGNMDRTWWAQFLEKYGTPFLHGKYDRGDPEGRSVLERAISLSKRLGGVVTTNETSLDLKEAARSDAGDAFEKFHNTCNREISKLVVGQTLSAEAQPTGLGSGVSKQQENVRDDIRQFDGKLLVKTLRDGLFKPFMEINRIPGAVPNAVFGSESPEEIKSLGEVLSNFKTAGVRVADDGIQVLEKRLGISLERDEGMGSTLPLAAVTPKSRRIFREDQSVEDSIIRSGSADLTQIFGGELAPIRQMILQSESPDDLEDQIKTFLSDWDPSRSSAVVEDALVAFAANGSLVKGY